MADQILEQAREYFEGQIDFRGQKLAEFLGTWLLVAVGGVAFIVGYFLQDIKLALSIGLGGTALTFLAVVPPWPLYNKHPVRWLPVKGSGSSVGAITVDGQVVG